MVRNKKQQRNLTFKRADSRVINSRLPERYQPVQMQKSNRRVILEFCRIFYSCFTFFSLFSSNKRKIYIYSTLNRLYVCIIDLFKLRREIPRAIMYNNKSYIIVVGPRGISRCIRYVYVSPFIFFFFVDKLSCYDPIIMRTYIKKTKYIYRNYTRNTRILTQLLRERAWHTVIFFIYILQTCCRANIKEWYIILSCLRCIFL